MPKSIDLPEQFGRSRILRKLGAGGMGAVFLAQDSQLDCRVAVKVSHCSATSDPKGLGRFQREAHFAQSIHHPYLCRVYEVDQLNGLHYLTMPFIEGQPLDRLLAAEGPWPARRAVVLVRRLALALQTLHQHKDKVIHRDLKPANIMLQANDEPMLMDFGLARSLVDNQPRLTSDGKAMGTPEYMAPEQIKNDVPSLGPWTDVWSL